jgi:hypothetical protein
MCVALTAQPGFSRPFDKEVPSAAMPRAWRIIVSKDAFAGTVRCRVEARHRGIFLSGDAVAFRVGRKADVLDALIRIDDGSPARWRDMLPDLARRWIPIDGRDLASPTDGLIWLPTEDLSRRRACGRI